MDLAMRGAVDVCGAGTGGGVTLHVCLQYSGTVTPTRTLRSLTRSFTRKSPTAIPHAAHICCECLVFFKLSVLHTDTLTPRYHNHGRKGEKRHRTVREKKSLCWPSKPGHGLLPTSASDWLGPDHPSSSAQNIGIRFVGSIVTVGFNLGDRPAGDHQSNNIV